MFNDQFLGAPAVFANNHTLYPFADAVVNQGQMKALSLSDGSQFTQVQGENKVAWCNIVLATGFSGAIPPDITGDYRKDRDLYLMRITYAKSGEAFPVYYLPWAPNAVFRIKLKPSPNHPTQTGMPFFKTTVEPSVFVTAAVQGCSVIVSGDAKQPVVYHLNAQAVQGPLGEELSSPNDHDALAAANAKRLHMLGRYNLARTEKPKEGRKAFGLHPPQTFTSQSAHVDDYMPDMLGTRHPALVARYLHGVQGEVSQFGTVFGVRVGENWSFYRQTRTRVVRLGPYNPLTLDYDDQSGWVDPVCVRFWP